MPGGVGPSDTPVEIFMEGDTTMAYLIEGDYVAGGVLAAAAGSSL
jgi:hypothetical protein